MYMDYLMKYSKFKIETISTTQGNELFISPERGGIITSLKLNNTEVLYLDTETFQNKDENVRGGIPILFPNSGIIPLQLKNLKFPELKQHGFARNNEWSFEKTDRGFIETLKSNFNTRKIFPYNFELKVEGLFENDNSLTLIQSVENKEEAKELPVSYGLHPYFKVLSSLKCDINFNFIGGDYIKQNFDKWSNGNSISIDNPGVPMEVEIPNLGTLILSASKEYHNIWVWSQPEKDFICIEPIMRDVGGIISNPELVKPMDTFSSSFNIKLI